MPNDREAEIEKILQTRRHSESIKLMTELLQLRRERYRDRIEKQNDEIVRGRSLECKDILNLLIDTAVSV